MAAPRKVKAINIVVASTEGNQDVPDSDGGHQDWLETSTRDRRRIPRAARIKLFGQGGSPLGTGRRVGFGENMNTLALIEHIKKTRRWLSPPLNTVEHILWWQEDDNLICVETKERP